MSPRAAPKHHDVLIIGSGLVGGSLACALAAAGRDVALIEASDPQTSRPPSFDERNLALAAASLNALGTLGVLAHLQTAPSPIKQIHVSRAGDFGSLQLKAADYGRDAFGGVVVARELGAALEARMAELPALTRYRPLSFVSLSVEGDSIDIEARAPGAKTLQRISGRLLAACDGSDSAVRQALSITADRHDYQQSLVVSALSCDKPHGGVAWERFTDSGPLALLPRADGSFGCVAGVPTADVESLLALSDDDWLAWLQDRFGGRAGRFRRVGKRVAYPIASSIAKRLVAPRCVLLGNAAQTLHPIGAQGFNLGLRDALSLVELIEGADDPGAAELLADYPGWRAEDREQTRAFSDGLARFTSGRTVVHQLIRSIGLGAMSAMPGLRTSMVVGAMGFRGRVPALARASRERLEPISSRGAEN